MTIEEKCVRAFDLALAENPPPKIPFEDTERLVEMLRVFFVCGVRLGIQEYKDGEKE